MKNIVAVIFLFVNLTYFACGFYPYGEEVRYKLMNPLAFGFKDFQIFNYTPDYLYYSPNFRYTQDGTATDSLDFGHIENAKLWQLRCKKTITIEEIIKGIYGSAIESKNSLFILHLKEIKDFESLAYLKFAGEISKYNYKNDGWELKSKKQQLAGEKMILIAIKNANKTKDPILKKRYGFLAVRLAYYNTNTAVLKKTYNQFFKFRTEKNIIDYWALHFEAQRETDLTLQNIKVATVFKNAPDKRFSIRYSWNDAISLETILKNTINNEEKLAVLLFHSIRNSGKALTNLTQLAQLAPGNRELSFLLSREVNKLEDWILTPYYTQFAPTLSPTRYDYESEQSQADFLRDQRVLDLAYAKSLLNFIMSEESHFADKSQVNYLMGYLSKMLGENQKAINYFTVALKFSKSSNFKENAEYQLALAEVANQENGKAQILPQHHLLLRNALNQKNTQFLFAYGRELERLGNTTDAAFLYFRMESAKREIPVDGDYSADYIFWKAENHSFVFGEDYTENYFHYMDAVYSTNQVIDVLESAKKRLANADNKDGGFQEWLLADFYKQHEALNDLIATKYMRQDDLKNALTYFKKAGQSFYETAYFRIWMGVNPFYTNFYNEHTPVAQDSNRYTKIGLLEELISLKNLAQNPSNKNRDQAYFKIANCYLNMSNYGNAWLMKRYSWTSGGFSSGMTDDEDYLKCIKAKDFYQKAGEVSTSNKFKALCIRMAGRCEKYKIMYEIYENNMEINYEEYENYVFSQNKYYKKLKTDYADDYDALISNCQSFEEYFSARN